MTRKRATTPAGQSRSNFVLVPGAGGFGGSPWDLAEKPLKVPAPPRTASVYRIRIDLVGAKPPIWRRLELAGDLTLDVVHGVLQQVMGWWDGHLHAFRRVGVYQHFLTQFDLEQGDEGLAEADVRLDQVLRKVGDRLEYEYDFGDGWQHRLTVEQVRPRVDRDPPARCLTGRRACPPEDVGGIYRYNAIAAALSGASGAPELDPELREWLPGDFDPAGFDVDEVNAALDELASGTA
jgi:hypothetical protein